MRSVVLISAGRHPVSGKPVLPRLEAQAIRLAAALPGAPALSSQSVIPPLAKGRAGWGSVGAELHPEGSPPDLGSAEATLPFARGGIEEACGLHVGPDAAPAEQALGHGLRVAAHVPCPAGADPVDAIVARLVEAPADVIFAGRRGQGGDESGLVPYAVASRLGAALIPDVIAVSPGEAEGTLVVDQALPKGARRRLVVKTPCLLTVHPSAPAPLPFAFGQARRGRVERLAAARLVEPAITGEIEERPYRKRPKMMRAAPAGGSAADRLKAVTGEATSGGAQVLDHPSPETAAKEVLKFLRRVGVLAPAASGPAPDT